MLRRLSGVAPVFICAKSPTLAPFIWQFVWRAKPPARHRPFTAPDRAVEPIASGPGATICPGLTSAKRLLRKP
jgi:hypothetical protein